MSLRARVALVVVGVTTVALVIASFAVWSLVSRFLDDRLDQQLKELAGPAARAVLQGSDGTGPPLPGGLDPAGAYAEGRTGAGEIFGAGFLNEPTEARQVPDLPATIKADQLGHPFDTGGTGDGTEVGYRVLAQRFPRMPGVVVVGDPMLVTALPTTEVDATLRRLVTVEVVTGVAVAVVAAGVAWWLAGLGLRPLRRIEDTAAAIAAGDLSQRVDARSSAAEMVQLGDSLNTMLGRIEEAFDAKEASEARLRRFVADASHELRTPLTSIRGYAELFRRGAADDPETLARSMERIEGEATRMSRLVDDLLLLARLDEGRPLERTGVDLSALAQDAAHDAAAADPSRTITVDAPRPVAVVGDRERLTQVLVNLLANARAHTPPGTPVEVRVAVDGPHATVAVVDHGPGIAEAEREQVFNRFHRTDASRTRDRGGAGLGLAIVAAVVRAHGGTVDVTATPAGGATFTVRLPATPLREPTGLPQPV